LTPLVRRAHDFPQRLLRRARKILDPFYPSKEHK